MNRAGKCFVDGCDSYKFEEKITFFSAPKDPHLRKTWNDILNSPTKKLEPSHFVCEMHFDPNDVLKGLQVNESALPNKITRLKEGAVPQTIFKEESLECVADETEHENKFNKTVTNTKIKPEYVSIVSDNFLKNELKMEEVSHCVEVKQETETKLGNFFNDLFENKYIFGLTEYWGIHSCEPKSLPPRPCMVLLINTEKPRTIIFSQVNIRDGFPIYKKQVIINEQLEMSYFVGHTVVDLGLPKRCASLEELCNAINKYSVLPLCPGGPSCEEYKEVIHVTNCAYKDVSSRTWRHKNCIYFTQGEMQPCLFCHALPNYFKATLKKSKKLRKLREEMGTNVDEWPENIPILPQKEPVKRRRKKNS